MIKSKTALMSKTLILIGTLELLITSIKIKRSSWRSRRRDSIFHNKTKNYFQKNEIIFMGKISNNNIDFRLNIYRLIYIIMIL